MTGRCESCKHWQNPWDEDRGPHADEVPEGDAPRWGTCQLITLQATRRDWRNDPKIDVPAFTRDASDYYADLHTRADFGCTLHELRTRTTERWTPPIERFEFTNLDPRDFIHIKESP